VINSRSTDEWQKRRSYKNVEKLANVANSYIHTSLMINFHNQLNQRIQSDITWPFKRNLPEAEVRFSVI
jgi:hypothetical protein